MPSSDVQCRWGIVGCGSVAASFVAELQSRSSAPASSGREVHHSIACVSSSSQRASRAFVDAHIQPSTNKGVETYGTLMELLALPMIDAVFIASPHAARFHHASSALRAERAVLIPRPLAMSAGEARELCDLASRSKGNWLGIVARTPSDQHSIEGHLLWAADECARGRVSGTVESQLVPWSENIAVLAALDEVRRTGSLILPSEEEEEEEGEREAASPHLSSGAKHPPRSRRSSSTSIRSIGSNRNATGDGQYRPSSRTSLSSVTSAADVGSSSSNNKTSLRGQVQELQHVLRHKNALIQSLEQKAGMATSGTSSPKLRGRLSLDGGKSTPPAMVVTHASSSSSSDRRKRTTSTGSLTDEQQASPGGSSLPGVLRKGPAPDRSWIRSTTPTGGRISGGNNNNNNNSSSSSSNQRRATTPDNALRSPVSSVNQLGLAPVKEGNQSSLALGAGFSAPTVASEGRRVSASSAAMPNGLVSNSPNPATSGAGSVGNGAVHASPSASPATGGTGKVISQLTTELAEIKATLEVTKAGLRTAQRTNTTLQRTLEETKDALGRSRAENEASGQMVARKERQVQEALGRARKAETEAKDLGKASREWGTRVRQVEAELGEERMRKQRAEAQYEAISSSWKATRDLWEKEMVELRSANGSRLKENAADAKKMADTMKKALEKMQERQQESGDIEAILWKLEKERERAVKHIEAPVAELVKLLEQNEKVIKSQDGAVEEVHQELKRIIRLMRASAS